MEKNQCWLLQRLTCLSTELPYVIKEGICKIGRDPQNNITCETEWVSRHHCQIINRNGLVYLVDYVSTNGTYINKEQILKGRDTRLKHGDIITLGRPFSDEQLVSNDCAYQLFACQVIKVTLSAKCDFIGETHNSYSSKYNILESSDLPNIQMKNSKVSNLQEKFSICKLNKVHAEAIESKFHKIRTHISYFGIEKASRKVNSSGIEKYLVKNKTALHLITFNDSNSLKQLLKDRLKLFWYQ